MFEVIKRQVLRALRVPPEPHAPFGRPDSVSVFRASRRLYWLRLARWGLAQAGALAGIIFWFAIIAVTEHEAARVRANPQKNSLASLPAGRNRLFVQPLGKVPSSLFLWLWLGKGLGLTIYASQLLMTYVAVRLDYELRWYIVTDRSLRIRSGLWKVQELTMSFANLQQVIVSQGPLERFLGIANVRVQSAGGGGKSGKGEEHTRNLHAGIFEGVENAETIRNLILERLKQFRDAGLGDPEDRARAGLPGPSGHDLGGRELLDASRGLLEEVRRLRHDASRPGAALRSPVES